MDEPLPPPTDTVAPPRNFTLSVEDRLRAYAQGAPGYIRRRKRIEDLEERLVSKLAAKLPPSTDARDPAAPPASADLAADLELLNELIARHNLYYPIEANLPVDVRTGRLLERGAPWRPLPRVTLAELLARAAARRTPGDLVGRST